MTPSFASLEKICDAFGITLPQFFADGEESVVLTPSQRKMLDKWNCLTEAQHNSLLILMDSMQNYFYSDSRELPAAAVSFE